MANEFWLNDRQWSAIEPLLPRNQPGARRVDDRRVISGIVHVLKVGCRWEDCPALYGPSTTVYNRFNRWSRRGLWQRLFAALVTTDAADTQIIDSTTAKAHRSAGGGKGGALAQAIGRSRGRRADLSVRTPPGFDVDALVRDLRDRLPAGDIEVLNSVAACRAGRSTPVVRALMSGIRRLHGQPRLLVKTATSDMNTLAEVWDVPMATYGPGDSRLDHADTEHIVLSDYLRGIDVLSIAISELAHLPVRSDGDQHTGSREDSPTTDATNLKGSFA